MRNIMLIALIGLTGCAKYAVRDAGAYQLEHLAAISRQEQAAKLLRSAALMAVERGDHNECVRLIAPAMILETYGPSQGRRALWLANIPYPDDSGYLPPMGTKQPDPGPAPDLGDPVSFCKEAAR